MVLSHHSAELDSDFCGNVVDASGVHDKLLLNASGKALGYPYAIDVSERA